MKYYIYVSDTKVDMLFAQIPTRLRDKVATELKIDLKVLSATFKEDPSEATRFSKLKVVVKYIEKYEQVGTVDAPENFFSGTLTLRWGPYPKSEMVYFGGMTNETVLGLAGSLKHVLGEVGTTPILHAYSTPPYILSVLEQGQYFPSEEQEEANRWPEDRINRIALSIVSSASRDMIGPAQKIEFFAKRFIEGPEPGYTRRVLLGSPIFVALAE